MNDQINNQNLSKKGKKKYNRPEIKSIKIDNEISLVMTSPGGDPPPDGSSRHHHNNNHFKY